MARTEGPTTSSEMEFTANDLQAAKEAGFRVGFRDGFRNALQSSLSRLNPGSTIADFEQVWQSRETQEMCRESLEAWMQLRGVPESNETEPEYVSGGSEDEETQSTPPVYGSAVYMSEASDSETSTNSANANEETQSTPSMMAPQLTSKKLLQRT